MDATTATAEPGISAAQRRKTALKQERRFFSGISIAIAIAGVIGFSRSYYFKFYFQRPPALDWLLHVHGLLMSSWMVLLLVQCFLVGKSRTDVHRRLGMIGLPLATAMALSAVAVAVSRAHAHVACSRCAEQLTQIAVPLFSAATFVALVATAIHYRKRPDVHKRLVIIASVEFVTPAIGRLAIFDSLLPDHAFAYKCALYVLADSFLLGLALYDLKAKGRVLPATLWGSLFVVGSQVLQEAIQPTALWISFVRWIAT